MLRDFGAALMLLTRVPAKWLTGAGPLPVPGRSVWAYPLVGAAVGAGGAGVSALCRWAGMPPALAAVWTVVALVLVTGGLHEDGLADVADGFGGGRTRERKLQIMRDSRIGSYGALALILSAAIRITALAALPAPAPALIASGALSRAGMAGPALLLRPARVDGLGASLRPGAVPAAACLGLGSAIAAILLPAGPALGSVLAAAACALGVTALARAQLGGFTGDVLGACAAAIECAVLTLLAAWT